MSELAFRDPRSTARTITALKSFSTRPTESALREIKDAFSRFSRAYGTQLDDAPPVCCPYPYIAKGFHTYWSTVANKGLHAAATKFNIVK